MNSYLTIQTIGLACGIGFLAYCVYFDRRRRNSPNYRENVKLKRENERKARESDDEIELPPVEDKAAIEKFFVREIEIGEESMQAGEIDRAVKHLSYAVVFCPHPQQLLRYLQEVLPTAGYTKLVENVATANKRVNEAYKKSNLQEEDVE